LDFDPAEIYVPSSSGGEFWQGEILSDVTEIISHSSGKASYFKHPLAIIVSADCDLTQDHLARSKSESDSRNLLRNILLCDVVKAEQLKDLGKADNTITSKVWDWIQQNNYPRYQYLCAVRPECDSRKEGFASLAIDFKQYFCVETTHLMTQASNSSRRCRLAPPFAQHLAQRFFNYQCRIGLPIDHHRVKTTTT